MFMTFLGDKRWERGVHPHESPATMTVPLIVLAALSVLGGVLLLGDWITDWLTPVVGSEDHGALPFPPIVYTLMVVTVVAAGVAVAWFTVASKEVPREAPQRVSVLTRAARADLYGDAFNEAVLMRPGDASVRGLTSFDDRVVDGTVDGSSRAAAGMSDTFRRIQTGYVRSYAASLFAGALLVVVALLAVNLA
jgi:NADH-quinone oxidoreductase subunit L